MKKWNSLPLRTHLSLSLYCEIFYNDSIPELVSKVIARWLIRDRRYRRRIANFDMLLRPADILQSRLLLEGVWEPAFSRWWAFLASRSATVVDVGSHCGYYALYAATTNMDCIVHAFEPNKALRGDLVLNLRVNNVSQRVRVDGRAVTDNSDGANLFVREVEPATAGTSKPSWPYGKIVPVRSVSLDEYIREQGIEKVDLVKMDIEGGEVAAIRGMLDGLRRRRYRWLLLETHDILMPPAALPSTRDLLCSCGYSIFRVGETFAEPLREEENIRPRDRWLVTSPEGAVALESLRNSVLSLPDDYASIWAGVPWIPY